MARGLFSLFEAIILAGGGSTRIGKNKALLSIGGVSVIQRIIAIAEAVVDRIIVVLKKWDDNGAMLDFRGDRVRFVFEDYAYRNPLIGIYTGLIHSNSEYSLVLPCDTPFINSGVLKYLTNACEGFDLTIPRWDNGYLEPLCAVYRKMSMLAVIGRVEDLRDAQIKSVITRLPKIKYVQMDVLREFDEGLLTFYNINTLEDYERALLISRKLDKGSSHGESCPP